MFGVLLDRSVPTASFLSGILFCHSYMSRTNRTLPSTVNCPFLLALNGQIGAFLQAESKKSEVFGKRWRATNKRWPKVVFVKERNQLRISECAGPLAAFQNWVRGFFDFQLQCRFQEKQSENSRPMLWFHMVPAGAAATRRTRA
jgi:hypothetical protein